MYKGENNDLLHNQTSNVFKYRRFPQQPKHISQFCPTIPMNLLQPYKNKMVFARKTMFKSLFDNCAIFI